MSITFAVAIYFVVWWTTLFAVLPLGVRTQEEDGNVVPGTPESAPTHPRMLRVILINTAVASVVFTIIWTLVTYRFLPLGSLLGPAR
jgi:predicted secreted protein